jgi:DNA topoisomerase IB
MNDDLIEQALAIVKDEIDAAEDKALASVPEVEEKHLPGQHKQVAHGGDDVAAPPHVDPNTKSPIAAEGPHIIRHRLEDKEVTTTLKNGTVKKRMVPVYRFVHSVTGKEVTDEKQLAAWRKLAPPAVTDVRINLQKDAAMTATWLSAAGVLCYGYSKAHSKEAAAEKFERLSTFHKLVPKMRKRIIQDMDSPNPKVADTAVVAYLIDRTAFRLGGLQSKKENKYGATTLLSKHVTINGDKLSFKFIGKHGVEIRKTLTDKRLAAELSKRKSSQWSKPLFNVTPGRVSGYIKEISGDKFTPRDYRTYHGTEIALREIKKRKGPAPDEKTFKQWQKEVGHKAGKFLGHADGNANMSVDNYIDYHVWAPWRKAEWGPYVPKKMQGD